MGSTTLAPPWRPWFDASLNIRSVRPAAKAWIADARLARAPEPNVAMPILQAGLGLPTGLQSGFLYGRATNLHLAILGAEVNAPFLKPSVESPGLWARVSYIRPMGLAGLQLHLPAVGFYLTNEFLRTPVRGWPMTAHIHAGVQQTVPIAIPENLQGPSGKTRGVLTFPASTQFTLGLGLTRRRWILEANAGYASSKTNIDGVSKDRAFWNQAYRLGYRFDEHP